MNIAIFNWRDLEHPKAGGAEVVTDELARGLGERGHVVTWFTSRHPGAASQEMRNGYSIERRGSELTCRLHAYGWLRNRDDIDVVVDEVNTLPFLSRFATHAPVVLWMHQLAREIWLAEAPPVVGRIGYALEPALLSLYRSVPVATGSQSSAASLAAIGLQSVRVIAYPLPRPDDGEPARASPGRIGYVGRVTRSKRIGHIIRALALVRAEVPYAELVAIGAGTAREMQRLRRLAHSLGVANAVTFTGRLSSSMRDEQMRTFDVLAMSSLREGWGLVVSEAARFRIPSVVYPVPGLVDSVQDGHSGIVAARQEPEALAVALSLVLRNRDLRNALGAGASEMLLPFTRERFVGAFEEFLRRQLQAR